MNAMPQLDPLTQPLNLSPESGDAQHIIIAGPCSAETEEQVMDTARQLADAGISYFRAGIWKPRTLPDSFEGVGQDALSWLKRVQKETGLRTAVEVANGPDALVVGARNGYFTESEAADVASEIAASGADMLFLGISSPKKETFLGRFADHLGVPVMHGVGGSFDVMAGVTQRAPEAWQRWGVEWAYRLKQEPRRLWRRYLTTNTKFVALTMKEVLHPTRLARTAKGVGGAAA